MSLYTGQSQTLATARNSLNSKKVIMSCRQSGICLLLLSALTVKVVESYSVFQALFLYLFVNVGLPFLFILWKIVCELPLHNVSWQLVLFGLLRWMLTFVCSVWCIPVNLGRQSLSRCGLCTCFYGNGFVWTFLTYYGFLTSFISFIVIHYIWVCMGLWVRASFLSFHIQPWT